MVESMRGGPHEGSSQAGWRYAGGRRGCRLAVVAFGASASGLAPRRTTSWVSYFTAPSPYGIAQAKGAQREAKAMGATSRPPRTTTAPATRPAAGCNHDRRYQGMIIYALDGHGLAPTIKQAVAKGSKVVVGDYARHLDPDEVANRRRAWSRQSVRAARRADHRLGWARFSGPAPSSPGSAESRARSRSCTAWPTTRPTPTGPAC